MTSLLDLSFTAPYLLAALAGLPVLWWLLKVMPPEAKRVTFPPIVFLMRLRDEENTPHHTPLWLLILRLLIAALIIIGLAGPIMNPPPKLIGTGPVVLVIDDGWGSASTWSQRLTVLSQTIDQAGRDERSLAFITTASKSHQYFAENLMSAPEAKRKLQDIEPTSWPTDRAATAQKLSASGLPALTGTNADFIFLSDGLDDKGSNALLDELSNHGRVFHLTSENLRGALALAPPRRSGGQFSVEIQRAKSGTSRIGRVKAIDERGRSLASAEFEFEEAALSAATTIELPLELQNTIARIEIEGERSAGAISLVDERWKRRMVGITTAGTGDIDRPLLSDVFYVERALAPFAETSRGNLIELLDQPLTALILPDMGQIPATQLGQVSTWVENGGLLIRFAGPRLAAKQDDLVPVPLRQGGRALGGALSWGVPQKLARFDNKSPFFGLSIPGDVTVLKQVLAEPSIDLASHTWARLSDGTPLVTARRFGDGWTVLFHITANPDWSTLPMSGLFVEMLQRTVAYSHASSAPSSKPPSTPDSELYLDKVVSGFGELVEATEKTDPIALIDISSWMPNRRQPPGIYQRPAMVRVFNLTRSNTKLHPMPQTVGRAEPLSLGSEIAKELKASFLIAAFVLALLDGLVLVILGSRFDKVRLRLPHKAAPLLLCAATILFASALLSPARADAREDEALRATLKTHLAFVITGDAETDRMSRAGLKGLSDVLAARTAVEPGAPLGVNLETDELAFFPAIYWPVSANHEMPSPKALEKLDRFMRTGGTVIFDTGDQQMQFSQLRGVSAALSPNGERLKEILGGLDIPPLAQVPDDHVLTKSFYLLREFPGRWAGGKVWVEANSAEGGTRSSTAGGSLNDGVSSVIIGGHDWAAAWAIDSQGRPMAATVPGSMRQRELAYRFGVNIVMYTLTGNYKADQVHVPALLERLGE
jgi:uncharacterized protein DUF4159/aerotolerance regulator-like protein